MITIVSPFRGVKCVFCFYYRFFAAIAILQFFSRFSTISPGLVIIPLLVVLLISGGKDGYEDIKRHQSDRQVNHSKAKILNAPDWRNPNNMRKKSKTFIRGLALSRRKKASEGDASIGSSKDQGLQQQQLEEEEAPGYGWKPILWEDLRVGDYVKLSNNEQVPADLVICSTSEEENVAYVETKNLDGETNLKSRNAVSSLTELRSARACANIKFTLDADRPDENMYKLNAKVVMRDENVRPQPVDLQNVLLRGTVIRNTTWVIGVVLFTGEDTKVVMNSSGAPSKRSKVEKQ